MSDEPYLLRLGTRLTAGLTGMDAARKQRHRDFILKQQLPDGGFRGREGDSDLYYTGFAVRSLMMLDGLTDEECTTISGYFHSCQQERLNVIDLLSWLYTGLAVQLSGGGDLFADAEPDWIDRIALTLESVRTADGGYAKTTAGSAGSTYHSFLVTLIYQLVGRDVPNRNALIQFLYDRQRDDGGFVEIQPMKRSGTNPTAAAIGTLHILDAIDEETRLATVDFLADRQTDEGGLAANTRIPFADVLSSFTGLLTLQDLNGQEEIDQAALQRFAESLQSTEGGFLAHSIDEARDVEYTFYGLGTLALLANDAME